MSELDLSPEQLATTLRDSAHVRGEIHFLEALAQPGMIVTDIGGNKGITAIRLAQAVGSTGHVYAFEPVPQYCAALHANVSANGVVNVTCCQCAVGNRNGTTKYFQHGEGSGIVSEPDAVEIEVPTITLDRYVETEGIDRIDLMNMDCEGSELYVLQGAAAVLNRFHPRVFCEIHHGYLDRLGLNAAVIVRYLEDRGYEVTPVQVETPEAEVTLEQCSHLRAVPRLGVRS